MKRDVDEKRPAVFQTSLNAATVKEDKLEAAEDEWTP